MRLNIEFVLCESTADDDQLNLLTSDCHCLDDMSSSILRTSHNIHKHIVHNSPRYH